MYKLTLIVALAAGSMAFVQSNSKSNHIFSKEKSANSDLLRIASSDQGGKGNQGGGGNQGGNGNQGEKASQSKGGDHGNKGNQGGQPKQNQQGAQGKGTMKQNPMNNQPKYVQVKEHGNGPKQQKMNQPSKGHGNKPSKMYSNKPGKHHYDKGHPNFGYVYPNKHGYISYRNYGQWRSEQARNKHKKYHPVYEYEAVDGFRLIISRNVFLFSETSYKINLLRVRLGERRKANQITVIQYETTIQRIAVLEQRRAQLQINIVL